MGGKHHRIQGIDGRKFPITTRPRINIRRNERKLNRLDIVSWGLTFDNGMNWLEYIKNTKARAEKKINVMKFLAHTTWGADQGSLLKVLQMIDTLRYGEESYGSATEAVMKKLKPTHNRGVRLALGVFGSAEPRTSCARQE
jgi:hypothetical protein